MDAEAFGGLELGLVEVADAAHGHQPRGFLGQARAAFVGAGFGVLACAVHGASPVEPGADCSAPGAGRAWRPGQKMSNDSSSGVAFSSSGP